MGLGAFHGADNNERRREILNWFLAALATLRTSSMRLGERLLAGRFEGERVGIYAFPGVGRIIYIEALSGFIDGSR